MHLSHWLNCPNFPCAAGFFTVGGSTLLAYVPVFLIATFLLPSTKDERVEAPRWVMADAVSGMGDRPDCMTALDHGRLAS
jgi:hypothetical protein